MVFSSEAYKKKMQHCYLYLIIDADMDILYY
jgi:hypothetical protein